MVSVLLIVSASYPHLQRLRQFKVDVKEFTDANDDANKFKNRISNALPCKLLLRGWSRVSILLEN